MKEVRRDIPPRMIGVYKPSISYASKRLLEPTDSSYGAVQKKI